jgi:hypothetical protein
MEDMYPRWTKAQKYAAAGFQPIDCFAGQVRVRGKRVTRQPFSVFSPNDNLKCCGTLVKSSRTDEHGHFFVEPMSDGEYFAQFEFKGVQHTTNFAIVQSYAHCGSEFVEINFSDPNKAQLKESVAINDSGEECGENEPQCYHK